VSHPLRRLKGVLLAVRCPVCGALGAAPCPACAAALRPSPAGPVPSLLDGLTVLLAYEGVGRELVARLKYHNARASLHRLAASMAALVDSAAVDLVTWAPTTAKRRRQRGFDQAELLARAVARCLRLPCRRLLTRHPGPAQTGRSRVERQEASVFACPPRARVPARVLVIDDVVTTGATLTAAARALRSSGALEVWGLVAARTPRASPSGVSHDPAKGLHSSRWAARGSVVVSRRQPQAKRPT
jgi:ComF family protein